MIRDPQSHDEWQDAVDAAHALLCLESMRQYGLITGGPQADMDRCLEILRRGKRRGLSPCPDAAERYFRQYNEHVRATLSPGQRTKDP